MRAPMPATTEDWEEGGDASGQPGDPADSARIIDAAAGAGERLDRFLARVCTDCSRSRLQHWITLGAVLVDGVALPAKTRLSGIESIEVRPQPREADRAFEPDRLELVVVHEDDELIVIDKPAGMVVHPAPGHWRGTLLNGLLWRWPAQAALARAGIVHRLDRDTSGLLVVGRSERAVAALTAQLADRSMSRRYLALVGGRLEGVGQVTQPIGRDPRNRLRMAVLTRGGRPAVTHWRALAEGSAHAHPVTAIECRLETGRTHQIRVHMKWLAHPLLGDTVYGGLRRLITRQALHAARLGLVHPADGRECTWSSPMPEDLATALAQAGIDAAAVEAGVRP